MPPTQEEYYVCGCLQVFGSDKTPRSDTGAIYIPEAQKANLIGMHPRNMNEQEMARFGYIPREFLLGIIILCIPSSLFSASKDLKDSKLMELFGISGGSDILPLSVERAIARFNYLAIEDFAQKKLMEFLDTGKLDALPPAFKWVPSDLLPKSKIESFDFKKALRRQSDSHILPKCLWVAVRGQPFREKELPVIHLSSFGRLLWKREENINIDDLEHEFDDLAQKMKMSHNIEGLYWQPAGRRKKPVNDFYAHLAAYCIIGEGTNYSIAGNQKKLRASFWAALEGFPYQSQFLEMAESHEHIPFIFLSTQLVLTRENKVVKHYQLPDQALRYATGHKHKTPGRNDNPILKALPYQP